MKTITVAQIAKLSPIIERAWEAQGFPNLGKLIVLEGGKTKKAGKTDALNMFRRGELFEATTNGAASYKDVLNNDFEAVAFHFLKLAGEDGEAMNAAIHEQTRFLRQRIFAIKQMIANAGKATGEAKWCDGYWKKIVKMEYKKEAMEQLTEQEISQLLSTISERTRAAMKKAGRRVATDGAIVFTDEQAAQFAAADEAACEAQEGEPV